MQVGSGIFYAGVVVGSFFSVLGGYVCARISGQKGNTEPGALALICVLLGLLMTFEQYSALMSAVMAIVGGTTVMLGAYLGDTQLPGSKASR